MQKTKYFLGSRIKEIRKKLRIKQSELAELIDVDAKHMSKIECGRCFPSFELLDKISVALNTPIVEFFYNEHLQSREKLTKELINKINNLSDEKFHSVYKILKELL